MHLHFEKNTNTKCDCSILSLSWMGRVPEDIPTSEVSTFMHKIHRPLNGHLCNKLKHYHEYIYYIYICTSICNIPFVKCGYLPYTYLERKFLMQFVLTCHISINFNHIINK